jgi:hypothetical protein
LQHQASVKQDINQPHPTSGASMASALPLAAALVIGIAARALRNRF